MNMHFQNIEFVALSRAARMPRSCWGRYLRVAVVAVNRDVLPEGEPRMISRRSRGVEWVVETWERVRVGKTAGCAAARAMQEAQALARELNDMRGDLDAVSAAALDTLHGRPL